MDGGKLYLWPDSLDSVEVSRADLVTVDLNAGDIVLFNGVLDNVTVQWHAGAGYAADNEGELHFREHFYTCSTKQTQTCLACANAFDCKRVNSRSVKLFVNVIELCSSFSLHLLRIAGIIRVDTVWHEVSVHQLIYFSTLNVCVVSIGQPYLISSVANSMLFCVV
jgi:hypothetical protein